VLSEGERQSLITWCWTSHGCSNLTQNRSNKVLSSRPLYYHRRKLHARQGAVREVHIVLCLSETCAVPLHTIVNVVYHTVLSGKVQYALYWRWSELLQHGIIFLEDSALPYHHYHMQRLLTSMGRCMVIHPPQSSYLSPCAYSLLSSVSTQLGYQLFWLKLGHVFSHNFFTNPIIWHCTVWLTLPLNKPLKKLNSVAFSPQVNYIDRATAACRRS
jgi:hypothetical protein